MRLSISSKPARAAVRVAVAARLFMGLVVDMPTTQNGAWISALIGGILAAPLVFCLARHRTRRRVWLAPLGAFAVMDAAGVLSGVARSAGYLALDRSPDVFLALPVALAALWCLFRGGNAIGYAAMIWARIAALLLIVVTLLQARYFHAAWLRPLLGDGWRAIIDGGVKSAGWIVAASAVLALAEDDPKPASPLPSLLAAVSVASVLILLRLMLAPTQLRGGWLIRLDALLCNGRAPLYLQLPLIVLWFAGLFHLLACELLAAAVILRALLAKWNEKLCSAVVVLIALALSRLDALYVWQEALSRWGFAVVGLTLIASILLEGGMRRCANGD